MAATRGHRPGILPADQLPVETRRVITPLTDVVSRLTGVSLAKIRKLPATASLADCITKINEIITRLQED